LDLSEPKDEQGLRAATCYERSFHLGSYGSSDGKALSPCSIVFGQSLRGKFGESTFHTLGWIRDAKDLSVFRSTIRERPKPKPRA